MAASCSMGLSPFTRISRRGQDMIDFRSHQALMVAEDRMRDLRREADLRRRLEGVRRQPRRLAVKIADVGVSLTSSVFYRNEK